MCSRLCISLLTTAPAGQQSAQLLLAVCVCCRLTCSFRPRRRRSRVTASSSMYVYTLPSPHPAFRALLTSWSLRWSHRPCWLDAVHPQQDARTLGPSGVQKTSTINLKIAEEKCVLFAFVRLDSLSGTDARAVACCATVSVAARLRVISRVCLVPSSCELCLGSCGPALTLVCLLQGLPAGVRQRGDGRGCDHPPRVPALQVHR